MPSAANPNDLAFQFELLGVSGQPGTWQNVDFGKDSKGNPVGGQKNPLSYNIMPLPQDKNPDGSDNPNGFILKNFTYFEFLNFNDSIAVAAKAPNRGGLVAQNARALFYEQQVQFAEGPSVNNVVHVENGAWLWLPRFVQQLGAYPPNIDQERVEGALDQPEDVAIAKQISVPHGNSILALGSFDTLCEIDPTGNCTKRKARIPGSPIIPDAPCPFPTPRIPKFHEPAPPSLVSNLFAQDHYSTMLIAGPNGYENPQPNLTLNANLPLQMAVAIIKPDEHMHWRVTTEQLQHGKGIVTNIPFERRVSEVTDYFADYWLLFKKDGGKTTKYLSYTQTILMRVKLEKKKYGDDDDKDRYLFPHVTCNTVTLIS